MRKFLIGAASTAGIVSGAVFGWWLLTPALDLVPQPPAAKACLEGLPIPTKEAPNSNMVALPGGRFMTGARPALAEEGPPRLVDIAAFMIARTDVTNAQFAAFADATGYRTRAEREGASAVFVGATGLVDPRDPGQWWRMVKGASWRQPYGPGSSIDGREHLPVVHIAFDDARAYADWLGHDLPTEAEWEYAARADHTNARYIWGEDPPGKAHANIWHGIFPIIDQGDDGYRASPSPVGCFPANGFGLFDMAGNVWQWTRDPYDGRNLLPSNTLPSNTLPGNAHASAGPAAGPLYVIKGGSYLCADNFCLRYRPDARTGAEAGLGMSHIGFRTVFRSGRPATGAVGTDSRGGD